VVTASGGELWSLAPSWVREAVAGTTHDMVLQLPLHRAGSWTVSGSFLGANLGTAPSIATVTVPPGAVSAARSSFSFPASVIAHGKVTCNLKAHDALGNPVGACNTETLSFFGSVSNTSSFPAVRKAYGRRRATPSSSPPP